jgi:hypothetical protein
MYMFRGVGARACQGALGIQRVCAAGSLRGQCRARTHCRCSGVLLQFSCLRLSIGHFRLSSLHPRGSRVQFGLGLASRLVRVQGSGFASA